MEALRKPHASKPRNPIIANVCFKGGYIESWGSGTIRIIKTCKDKALPEPEFMEQDGGFAVILHTNTTYQKLGNQLGNKLVNSLGNKLGKNAIKIMDIMRENPGVSISELAERLSLSTTAIENNIKKLKELGIVERVGTSPRQGLWQVLELGNQLGNQLGNKLVNSLGNKLGKNAIKIVDIMRENPGVSISELAERLSLSTTAIENNIKKLKELGIVERVGTSPRQGLWQVLDKQAF